MTRLGPGIAVGVVRTGLLAGEMEKPERGAGGGARAKFEKFLQCILVACKPGVWDKGQWESCPCTDGI